MTRRLLLVARSAFPHRAAGHQRIVWDLAAGLRGRGWDVTLLTSPVPGRGREFGAPGLHVVTVPDSWPEWTEIGQRAWARGAPAAAARLDVEGFDAVMSVGRAASVLRTRQPRRVVLARDLFLDEGLRQAYSRTAAGPWALAEAARQAACLWQADGCVLEEPVAVRSASVPFRWLAALDHAVVVRGGVPTRRFAPDPEAGASWRATAGIPEGVPLVVTVARLEPGKGVGDALGAFHAFRRQHRQARLVLVGTGPTLGAVRERASELNLGASLRMAGKVPDADLVRWLQAADLFLFLPRRCRSPPPRNVLEAVACGVPVVVSEAAVPAGRRHPLLHPVRTPGQAALALGRLWREQVDGRRARPERLLPEWTLQASAAQHDAALRSLPPAPPRLARIGRPPRPWSAWPSSLRPAARPTGTPAPTPVDAPAPAQEAAGRRA